MLGRPMNYLKIARLAALAAGVGLMLTSCVVYDPVPPYAYGPPPGYYAPGYAYVAPPALYGFNLSVGSGWGHHGWGYGGWGWHHWH